MLLKWRVMNDEGASAKRYTLFKALEGRLLISDCTSMFYLQHANIIKLFRVSFSKAILLVITTLLNDIHFVHDPSCVLFITDIIVLFIKDIDAICL